MIIRRQIAHIGIIYMSEWAIFMGKVINNRCPDRNFHFLYRIKYKNPQFSIKTIMFPNNVLRSIAFESIISIAIRIEITTESIVIYGFQAQHKAIAICNESARKDTVGLFFKGERRFYVIHNNPPIKKNPPNFAC